jgi:hypothetical protein
MFKLFVKDKWIGFLGCLAYITAPTYCAYIKGDYSFAITNFTIALIMSIIVILAGYQNWKQILLDCQKCQKAYEIEQAKNVYDKLKQEYPENDITIIGSKEDIERIKSEDDRKA